MLRRRGTGWASSLRRSHLCRGGIWAAKKDPAWGDPRRAGFADRRRSGCQSRASSMYLRMENVQCSWGIVRWGDEVRAGRHWIRYLISHGVCSRILIYCVQISSDSWSIFKISHWTLREEQIGVGGNNGNGKTVLEATSMVQVERDENSG